MELTWELCVSHVGTSWQFNVDVWELYGIDMGITWIDMGIMCQSYGNYMAIQRE